MLLSVSGQREAIIKVLSGKNDRERFEVFVNLSARRVVNQLVKLCSIENTCVDEICWLCFP